MNYEFLLQRHVGRARTGHGSWVLVEGGTGAFSFGVEDDGLNFW